jgi:hypothetical protein
MLTLELGENDPDKLWDSEAVTLEVGLELVLWV